MTWKFPLSDIDYGEEEEEAVQAVLRSRWLTMGEVTDTFEREFAAYNNVKHAIAVSSCTAALHLACVALGLGPGDEVILPALTFVATANAVLYTGARPVFADITGVNNFNISPESISHAINWRTKAIIVMHYAGYSCDMQAIMALAKQHNLFVIEDAAHALGGGLDGKLLGTWGDMGCFSFFSNKNLVTGEGGMVVTGNDELSDKIKKLRSHGMTSLTWDRHSGHASSYDVVTLGYNYRLDEIHSALGRVQLRKLDRNNQLRRNLTDTYRQVFHDLAPAIEFPFVGHPGVTAAHIMPILLPEETERDAMMDFMKNSGIQTSMHYPPIYGFRYYAEHGYESEDLPATDEVAGREVTLPLYPGLNADDIAFIAQSAQDALEFARQ